MPEELKDNKEITQEDLKLFQRAFNASKKVEQIKDKDESNKKRNFIVVSSLSIILSLVIGILGYQYLNRDILPTYIEVGQVSEVNSFELNYLEIPSRYEVNVTDVDATEIDSLVVLAYNPNTTQQYLFKDVDKQVPIASITKLMSVLVALEEYELDDIMQVSELPEYLEYGFGLVPGDQISVKSLIHTMLLSSYNDSAYVLGASYPNVGYEGFIEQMNIKAEHMGMENTHFANTMGFDDINNYSTANDLQKLIQVVLNNEYMMSIVQKTSETIEYTSIEEGEVSITVYSTNDLLVTNIYAKGLKTGYTKNAGLCLIGYFDAGEGDEVVTIVLNAGDRFLETEQLLELIKTNYSY